MLINPPKTTGTAVSPEADAVKNYFLTIKKSKAMNTIKKDPICCVTNNGCCGITDMGCC